MKSKMSKACDIPMRIKKLVYERDDGKCIVCHQPGVPNAHFIPRSLRWSGHRAKYSNFMPSMPL